MDARLVEASQCGDVVSVIKTIKKLANPNARDEFMTPALSKAAKGGHFEVCRLLLEAQADPNAIDINSLAPLHHAAKGRHVETAKLLLLNGAKLDALSKEKLRPIDFCAYNSDIWLLLRETAQGITPELEDFLDVPEIPDFALAATVKKKKTTKKKKGKKGGKKGGKSKGKKKKKR